MTVISKCWNDMAYSLLLSLAETKETFTSDDLRELMGDINHPSDNRAIGSVMTTAQRIGVIEKTDQFLPSRRKNLHGAPRRVWRSRIFQS